MTNEQNYQLMAWIDEMLAGSFVHCKRALIIPNTNLRSAFGVTLEVAGVDKDDEGFFVNTYPVSKANQSVSPKWLMRRFGLVRTPLFYATMNDLKNDYFTVAASLLGECLQCDQKTALQLKLIDGFNASRQP